MKMGQRLILFPMLVISGLLFAFSASATMVCPTASPLGVGCPSEGGQQYYCNSGCRLMDSGYCPTNELSAVSPCATLDACGVCNTCISNYLLCTASAYPTRSCTYNDPANHCATLVNSNCNAGECASCTSGYSLCSTNHTCIATQSCQSWETFNACTNACEGTAPTLKLSFSSAGNGTTGNNVLQSSSAVLAISPSSFVGIGTTTPNATLEIIPTTGYSILAGNFKMGNIALPTADGDAATKGYVDSVISSATSSITTLWGGATDGHIWSLNSGNIGIGTTTPTEKLEVNGKLKIGDNTISGENITFDSETTVGMRVVNRYGYINLTPLNTGWAHIYTDRANFIFSKPLYIIGGKLASYSTANLFFSSGGTRQDMTIENTSGNVGIGTATPTARLSVVPTSGYSILAGNFKIGDVALPTADSDAATKGYVDSTVASATSSITGLPVGTTGQTLRYDGVNWVANSVLYNNGTNVGIGTAGPLEKLDVSGVIKAGNAPSTSGSLMLVGQYSASQYPNTIGGYYGTAGTVIGYAVKPKTGSAGYVSSADNTSWARSAINLSSDFRLFTGASQAVAIDSDVTMTEKFTVLNSGYVGIGTSTPATLLHAYSASGADSLMTFEAASSNAGFIAKANTDIKTGSFFIWNGSTRIGGIVSERTAGDILGGSRNDLGFVNYSSGNDIIFRTTAPPLATRLIIKSAGNVGIGTTTPLARLEVVPTSGYSILAGNYKIGNVASPTVDADAATKGYVDSALSSATSSITLWGGTTGGDIWSLNSGNVGIGTANPGARLAINPLTTLHGTVSINGTTVITGSGTSFLSELNTGDTITINGESRTITNVSNDTSVSVSVAFSTTASGQTATLASSAYTRFGGSSYARFYKSDNTLTEINSNSNGAYGLRSTSAIKGNGFYLYNSTGGFYTLAGVPMFYFDGTNFGMNTTTGLSSKFNMKSAGSTSASSALSITNSSSTNLLFVRDDGNVGIGTNAPARALHVYGTAGDTRIRVTEMGSGGYGVFEFYNNSGLAGAFFQNGSTNNSYGGPNSFNMINILGAPLILGTSGAEKMRITSTGNVGIGTTTPLAKLEIVPTSGYSILAGNYKIGNVASPTSDSDVATMGWVNSALSSVSGVAVYSTSTPATYSGSQGGYTSANALCSAVVSGTHVCTTGEMLNTINTGASATVPSGTTLWVSNGPPAYTANANDCMGWTSTAGGDYGTTWIKLASGDGFGSLNACNTARSYACCK